MKLVGLHTKGLRTSNGATIAEFGACLMIFLLATIPMLNVAVFGIAYFTLQIAAQEVVSQVALSESRNEALKTADTIYVRMQSPIWSGLHTVRPNFTKHSNQNELVSMHVISSNSSQSFSLKSQLPETLRPSYLNNRSNKRYAYTVDAPCEIQPMFNLAGFPLVGQIPIVGAPITLRLHAEAPVEYLESLDN